VVLICIRGPDHPRVRGEDKSFSPRAASPGDRNLAIQGVGSCASMACHHGGGEPGQERSEYTTWSNRDPHARAYAVLSEATAQQIVQKLDGPKARPATGNLLCLNCHVQPGLEALPSSATKGSGPPRLVLADGVGCENCHGPAEKWLQAHYREDWK